MDKDREKEEMHKGEDRELENEEMEMKSQLLRKNGER